MEFIQLMIMFTIFVVIKNHVYKKNKKEQSTLGSIIEIGVIGLLVITFSYVVPIFPLPK